MSSYPEFIVAQDTDRQELVSGPVATAAGAVASVISS